ncbi:hypothetical protein NW762_012270 [Fusarium torreyae]|uniref:DNA2/NAM7 helicase-like C-terminal domain-containing protein n=1 Tax=Fusarium torreyae TaxID=1237075 RepID=A0A9W8RP68_9HYPO|nr:hypothetical protein NW762_012270 [Fusarium torreyae]
MNPVHRAWVLEKVHALLSSALTGLGVNHNKPINVMMIAMYKGQVVEYHKNIRPSCDFFNRVKVKTVDGAQGDETDFLFIDMVNANYTGRIDEGGVKGDRACLRDWMESSKQDGN